MLRKERKNRSTMELRKEIEETYELKKIKRKKIEEELKTHILYTIHTHTTKIQYATISILLVHKIRLI